MQLVRGGMLSHSATCRIGRMQVHAPCHRPLVLARCCNQQLRSRTGRSRFRCNALSTTQADEALRSKRHITIEDLKDPAHIGGSSSSEVEVQDFGSDLSLESYMQLPVEQYYELDPTMIRPLGGKRFALQVPRVNLFNVWVEPLVEVVVHLSDQKDTVVIENLHLDQRFCLSFFTTLTWQGAASRHPNGSSPQAVQQIGKGRIKGDAKLDVWSEVVPPFHLMPRFALEATSNAVMGALVGGLLPRFMDRLGNDYKRWATDPTYRQARRAAAQQESLSA